MKKFLNVALLNVVLLGLVLALVFANYDSVTSPLNFEAARLERDNVVIDRLIDIRTAQVEFRAEKGRYAANFDELIEFLGNDMEVVNKTYILNDKQLNEVRDYMVADSTGAKTYYTDENGKKRSKVYTKEDAENLLFSEDKADEIVLKIIEDSKSESKANKRNLALKRLQKLDDLYHRDTTWVVVNETLENGEVVETKKPVVDNTMIASTFRRDTSYIPYVDTLFHNPKYNLQQLRYIPFSKDSAEFFMQADSIQPGAANRKAGGYIHVFEARADFIQYLDGLNKQELANYLLQVTTNGTEYREEVRLDKDGEPLMGENGVLKRKIPCRKVGDVTKNNNNAGNWPNR